MSPQHVAALVHAILDGFAQKDRARLEAAFAPDFHFTSPMDNRLDRAGYFRECWPHSKDIDRFEIVDLVVDGERAYVTYIGHAGRKRFRNTERITVRGDQVVEVEVYFGWDLPHGVPEGEHKGP
jgi:hypothetical protein